MRLMQRLFTVSVLAVFLGGLGVLVPWPVEKALAQTTDPVFVGAGDIANCSGTRDESTAQLLDSIAGTVFTLGDNAYPDGTLTEFNNCYGPTWGRHKDRTRPAPGNHDYNTLGAAGYYTYFGATASPLDTNCTSDCKGYYSYNLGAWHIIALNSEINHAAGSVQEQWLRADLAGNQNMCTLAYWHKPRFSSGAIHGNDSTFQPFWQALYDYGADVVLNGHDHEYERFAPQSPTGQADPTRGIREFVVGTGGAGLYSFSTIQPNSEVRNNTTFGVLKLTLHATSYNWEFVPIAGQTFTDAGSGNCVSAGPAPTATRTPTVPAAATNLSPNTAIGTNYNPNYTWDKVATATYYHLVVSGPKGVILDQWYQAVNICNTTTCSVASPTLLGGAHVWYVQTYNSAGYGPWSNNNQPTNFSTTIPTVPAAATNLSPNTAIGTNYNPNYTWNKVSTATWYRLYVSGPKGVILDQWYQTANICNTTTCSVASPTLGGGAHVWYVQTYNSAGYGEWSNNTQPTNFSTTPIPLPGPATNLSPNTAIGTNYNPTYTWNKATDAVYYELYVSGPKGVVLDQWYLASSICNATTCSVASPTPLGGGAHVWYVQTWNTTGYGPWSNNTQPTNFSTTVPTVPPVAAVLTAPSGTTANHTPTYTWNRVNMATWYRLYVSGPGGVVKDQWYQAASICNSTTCSVVSPTLPSGAHIWYVQAYNVAGYSPWASSTFNVNP